MSASTHPPTRQRNVSAWLAAKRFDFSQVVISTEDCVSEYDTMLLVRDTTIVHHLGVFVRRVDSEKTPRPIPTSATEAASVSHSGTALFDAKIFMEAIPRAFLLSECISAVVFSCEQFFGC